jgi:hypothetical protein
MSFNNHPHVNDEGEGLLFVNTGADRPNAVGEIHKYRGARMICDEIHLGSSEPAPNRSYRACPVCFSYVGAKFKVKEKE